MRKNQEINKAVAILRKKGDNISMVQADVLKNHRTEIWVFEHFVHDVPKSDQNEEVYSAARDAALFLSGKIELSDLIPGIEYDKTEPQEMQEEGTLIVSKTDFIKLLKRVERLERRMELQKEVPLTKRKSIKEASGYDLISQIEACKYVGCSKTTIKRWANNGFITGYLKGLNVYYSKCELDNSAIVKEHRANNNKEAES